ncbi:UDP-N-acetylglucosamine-peptide N-acetylglucosaminyltransferase [Burkholderia pseudomallei]|uniref:UDP-N-acetylglucosamine-peptide N-acetylglucosaminyltransferase n=1 Tax=Burkholderia pseudomallei TaxID=28450 RepID=UPI001269FDE4|nr:UDP-N-acetylglucosamine-peptide N-acetylglucosaminyltransferase [Burkholderia pseudomallei]
MRSPSYVLKYRFRFDDAEVNLNHANRDCLTSARALVAQAWNDPTSYHALLRESQALLEAALWSSPNDVAVITCLGAVLCDLHLHAEAREHLAHAITLETTDWNTYFNMFVAMLKCSTFDDARKMLVRGAELEADPVTWQAYFDVHAM